MPRFRHFTTAIALAYTLGWVRPCVAREGDEPPIAAPTPDAEQATALARAVTLESDGAAQLSAGDVDAAERAGLEALEIRRRIAGPDRPEEVAALLLVANARLKRIDPLWGQRRRADPRRVPHEVLPALVLYRRAQRILEAAETPDPVALAGVVRGLGHLKSWLYAISTDAELAIGILLQLPNHPIPAILEALADAGYLWPSTWGDSTGTRDRAVSVLRPLLDAFFERAVSESGAESIDALLASGYLGAALAGVAKDADRSLACLERAAAGLSARPLPDEQASQTLDRIRNTLWTQCVFVGDLDRAKALGCTWVESTRAAYAGLIEPLRALETSAKAPADLATAEALAIRDAAVTNACLHAAGDWNLPCPILAERVAIEGINLRRRRFGDSSVEVAAGIESLSLVLVAAGRFQEAAETLAEAVRIRTKLDGKDSAALGAGLAASGFVAGCLGDFTRAREAYRKAIAVRARDADSFEILRRRANAATLSIALGDFRSAHAELDSVLAGLRLMPDAAALLGANKESLEDVRHACRRLGRVSDEIALMRSPAGRLLEADPVVSATARAEGRWHDAVRLERDALGTALRSRGAVALDEMPADRMVDLGGALLDEGRIDEGYAFLAEATERLEIGKYRLADTNRLIASVLLDAHGRMAIALAQRGAMERALPSAEVAYRLHAAFPEYAHSQAPLRLPAPPSRMFVGAVVDRRRTFEAPVDSRAPETYARLLARQGKDAEAMVVLDDALTWLGTQVSANHPRIGAARATLAEMRLESGDVPRAREDAREALRILESAYGTDHPALVDPLLTMADADLLSGNLASSRSGYQRVRVLTDKFLDPLHPALALAKSGLAMSLVREGKGREAVAPMREALALVEGRIRSVFPGSSLDERLSLVAAVHWALANWVEVARAAGIAGYDETLRLKGLTGRTQLIEERILRVAARAFPVDVETLRAEQRRLARLVYEAPQRGWRRVPWRTEVAESAARAEAISASLVARIPALRDAVASSVRGERSVREQIPSDGVLVDFLLAGGRFHAFVAVRGRDTVRIDIGPDSAIEEAAEAFRGAAESATKADDPELAATAARLRTLVWAPIESLVPADTRLLYWVPDGALATVPWAALPVGPAEALLGDRLMLVYLSSATDLTSRPTRRGGGSAVLVGGVDYAQVDRPGVPAITGLRPLSERAGGMPRFSPLPGTADEIRVIEGILRDRNPPAPIIVLTADQVRERALRERTRGASLLHLATHGFVRESLGGSFSVPAGEEYRLRPGLERRVQSLDPMLLSGLALSGANVRTQEDDDDGILTAMEASELDLDDADLVFLAACSTARGVGSAGEGFAGLVRGFTIAGARQVVASLWPVSDESTLLLARRFYEHRAVHPEAPAVASLSAASKAVRADKRYSVPRHWAAFVAYGAAR